MDALLGASGEQRQQAFAALRSSLVELDGDPAQVAGGELPDEPLLHLAGQVAVHEDVEVPQEYLDRVAQVFDAGITTGDLHSEAGVDEVLGAWVREHTGGLIEESAITPSPQLRLVVQNAVTLGAHWRTPLFGGPDTVDFDLPGGESTDVEAMGGSLEVPALEAEGWQGVRLPYQGERLVADVLVPPEGTDPTRVTSEGLRGAVAGLDDAEPTQVELTLPTLDLSTEVDATDWLGERAPSLADGTGLEGLGGGFVSQVMQHVVLDMGEEGTVAAAVTEIAVGESAPPRPEVELVVDRPYLVRIADTETGLTLFLAAVNDPRQGS